VVGGRVAEGAGEGALVAVPATEEGERVRREKREKRRTRER
jgi:hypothetical protein